MQIAPRFKLLVSCKNSKTGGTAPPGFATSEWKRPELGEVFGLREIAPVHGVTGLAAVFAVRTSLNHDLF